MPFDLALADLVSPYVLDGSNIGAIHAALSVLSVGSYSTSVDEDGVVISGIARFHGVADAFIDPSNGTFGAGAANTEGHPRDDPARRDPWIDVRDTTIEFKLVAPRRASLIVDAAEAAIGSAPTFASQKAVLDTWDAVRTDAPPSDYPSTAFTLDLLLTSIVLRPPFLHGADLQPDGLLTPKPATNDKVTLTLPKIKVRLSQGTAVGSAMQLDLSSLGASGIDDPSDLGVAQLVTMDPPYAFIGDSHVVGFGFRSAILDLSDGSTPADVLSQFGYDESWQGLYLPEIRLFLAPHGMEDLALDVGARNLLIGFGASAGVTGDFDLEVIQQGSGHLQLGARFYDGNQRGYGITRTSDTAATVQLPPVTRMVVDISGGRAPYNAQVAFDGDAPTPGRVFDVDLTSRAQRTIHIQVTDSSGTPLHAELTVGAARQSAVAPAVGPAGADTPHPTDGQATIDSPTTPAIVIVSQTGTSVTVSLSPADPNTRWTVGGQGPPPSGATLTVDLPAGATEQTADVTADLPASPLEAKAYFDFDHPTETELESGYCDDPNNTRTAEAIDEQPAHGWTGGQSIVAAWHDALNALSDGTDIQIFGYASYEGDDSRADYNQLLSVRRAEGIGRLLAHAFASKGFHITTSGAGFAASRSDPNWRTDRNHYWRADITSPQLGSTAQHATARLRRPPRTQPGQPPATPPTVNDPPPNAPPPPPWFRSVAVRVRIVRDQFIACEIDLDVDFDTATEQAMRSRTGPGGDVPTWQGLGSQNPADGIVHFKAIFQIDPATGDWSVTLATGADPADRDGLLFTGLRPGQDPAQVGHAAGRDALGIFAVMTPLLAATAPVNPLDGDIGALALTGAAIALPFTLAALDMLHVERVVLYGGELVIKKTSDGVLVTLLADVETALSANVHFGSVTLLEIPRRHPLVVRYKAIGLKVGRGPSEPPNQLRPMFDASKGYTIDVSGPGAIRVPDPLGQVVQVLGARVARTNPLNFEVDLGFSLDLGVISVDHLKVRMPLDPPGAPQLTAIGVGVDIPGALRGHGYFEFTDSGGFVGQIDLTLVPINLRIAAGLGVQPVTGPHGETATAVIITLEIELPVAIPLGTSGIGIYGFLGLFAMHYERHEEPFTTSAVPALEWLRATGGDPANLSPVLPDGKHPWEPAYGRWAFGVGAVLGTMEGGLIFNVKGMLVLELPGPRILLVMKARLIQPKPDTRGNAEGNLLAVIDLDCGRGTLTIGIVATYEVRPLLSLRIPAEAFFNFNDLSDWHLYLGKYDDPIHASILQIIEGTAYLMISGNGIPAHQTPPSPQSLPAVSGFSIGVGLHASITWGSVDAGIYVRVAAGFDAVLGFSPFRLAGALFLQGELRLIIVSISAHANLAVDVGTDASGNRVSTIDGEVCGEIDLFFFSISACVHFHLGDPSVPLPPGPPLVNDVALVSRSPALVAGTGVDKGIDTALGNAVVAADEAAANGQQLPVVPVDAIPLIQMSATPQDGGLKFMGQSPGGSPGAPADGWVQRGDAVYRYGLSDVELIAHAGGHVVTPSVSAGATPATWWNLVPPTGDNLTANLALLSWVPDPTPKALGSSDFLDEKITDRWGTVCSKAAPPASVLWTFRREVLGLSPAGWHLVGEAWPDPPSTLRSAPPSLALFVDEAWRCGDPDADGLRGIAPAEVVGALVSCPRSDHGQTHPPLDVTGTHLDPAGRTISVADRALAKVVGANAALRGQKLVEVLTAGPPSTLFDLLDRSAQGLAVSRADLANAVLDHVGIDGPNQQAQCPARVLEAPMFDDGRLVAWGDPNNAERVKQAWDAAGYRPSPLADAVVFHTGPARRVRFLLWVQRPLLEHSMCARVLSADGTELDRIYANGSQVITLAALPGPWVDPNGPWYDDVQLAACHFATLDPPLWVPVLMDLAVDVDRTDRIELGVADTKLLQAYESKQVARPFFVAVVEALRRDEIVRYDRDAETVDRDHKVLQAALGPESADNAILLADTLYEVKVSSSTEAGQRSQPSDPVTNQQSQGATTTSYWFRTDDTAPTSLEPWLLCSTPAKDEHHVFWADPVSVAFATNDVGRIYEAYGKRLQVRLSAASYAQIDPAGGVPHPFPVDATTLHPVSGSVLSPWEDAVSNMIDRQVAAGTMDPDCMAVHGDRVRHSTVTVPIPLMPLTDYLLDLESADKSAPAGTGGPSVLRRSFSTSRYASMQDFAAAFVGTRVEHRSIQAGLLGPALAPFAARPAQGNELDAALTAVGLDPQGVPNQPRLIVLWEQAGPSATPEPAAVIVDGSEPLWRRRPYPTKVNDAHPSGAYHWELAPSPWLSLEVRTHAADPMADDCTSFVVEGPGSQRAVVVLAAGSRGRRLKVDLVRHPHPEPYLDGPGVTYPPALVADIAFLKAPWEE